MIILAFSIMTVFGLFEGILFFQHVTYDFSTKKMRPIKAIIQTSPQFKALDTMALAEFLDLSADKETSLDFFDLEEGSKKLLNTYLIKRAHLKKIKPGILYIDYSVRVPIAYLDDRTNTAVDEEGFLFPYLPFFTSQNLPHIYLGDSISNPNWGNKLKKEHIVLLADFLTKMGPQNIKRIDFSQMDQESLGKRQIILILNSDRILRLTLKNYAQELARYFILEQAVLKNKLFYVIDLRSPEIAYVERIENGKLYTNLLDNRKPG